MGAFQGRALKLETACKVTFPLKCHVFLEKSFFHLDNAFCHRAVSALLTTDLLKQKLWEKMENRIRGLGKQIKAQERRGQHISIREVAAHPRFLTPLGPSALGCLGAKLRCCLQLLPGGVTSLVHDLGRSRSQSQLSPGCRRPPVLQAMVCL